MSIKKISISWHCPILSWSETENKSRNIIQLCFYNIKYSTPLNLQKTPQHLRGEGNFIYMYSEIQNLNKKYNSKL
jgi:hypothetical protein